MKLVGIAIALAIGNFAYQAATGHHWDVAAERSFFQAMSILAASFAV